MRIDLNCFYFDGIKLFIMKERWVKWLKENLMDIEIWFFITFGTGLLLLIAAILLLSK